MRLSNLMIIYYRQTRKYWVKGITMLFLFAIAIVMIHMAFYEQSISQYNITVAKQLFKERENLYNIKVWVMDAGESTVAGVSAFLENLKRLDGVELSGRFYGCYEIFEEIQDDEAFLEYNREILQEMQQGIEPFLLDMYFVDRDLTELLGVEALSRAKHGERIPVLVGYDYKDYFREGEIYTNLEGVRYEICGVLPEGFCFPPVSLFKSDFGCEVMDDKLIALYDNQVDPMHIYILNGANSIYCVTDGREETVEKIKDLAKTFFINIEIATVDEMIMRYKEDNRWNLQTTALFTGIAVLAAFLAMIALSVIQIVLKKQEYGILLANGISRREGVMLIALENGMRQLAAFALGTIVAIQRIEEFAFTYASLKVNIFMEMVVWKTFLIVILLFIGSVSIPALVLSKMKIVDLLGGNEL